MAIRGFFAASVCREEFEFGRRSVVGFCLSFELKYATRGDRKRGREQKERAGHVKLPVPGLPFSLPFSVVSLFCSVEVASKS